MANPELEPQQELELEPRRELELGKGDLAIVRSLTKWGSCVIWQSAIHNNINHMRVYCSNSMDDQTQRIA